MNAQEYFAIINSISLVAANDVIRLHESAMKRIELLLRDGCSKGDSYGEMIRIKCETRRLIQEVYRLRDESIESVQPIEC